MYYLIISIFSFYLLFVLLLSFEGKRRNIGFINAFLISLFFTPITGLITIIFSPRKAILSHYVKVNKSYNGDRKDAKKALKISKNDDAWIKIKASDIGFA
ncbi:MAG: hypothetical protein K8R41_04835 [Bacteroidales bacterium]|nr:hypothetical protein [Bacteroidales bacterium]